MRGFPSVRPFAMAVAMVFVLAPVAAPSLAGVAFEQSGEAGTNSSMRQDRRRAHEARQELERCERDRQRANAEVNRRAQDPSAGGLFLPMFAAAVIDITCRERQQQAAATDQAIARALLSQATGESVDWTSEERPGVRGSSTVTLIEADCMTVTDIVIVDGQETRAPKRMCRRPPSNRYIRVT